MLRGGRRLISCSSGQFSSISLPRLWTELNQDCGSPARANRRRRAIAALCVLTSAAEPIPIRNVFIVSTPVGRAPRRSYRRTPSMHGAVLETTGPDVKQAAQGGVPSLILSHFDNSLFEIIKAFLGSFRQNDGPPTRAYCRAPR